jgi:excisionase family DNA binding protein
MQNDLYTLEEVAEHLKVSLQTVRRLVRANRLKTIRVGRQHRVTADALREFLRQSSQEGTAE